MVGRLYKNTNECFKHCSVLQRKIKNYLTSYMAGIWFVDNKINSSEYLYKSAEMFELGGNDFQSCFIQIFTKHSIEPLTEYKFLHTPIFWKFFFFFNKNEDQHFDHFWSSLTISKLHIHPFWALGKKLSILKSETLTQTRKSYEILCEKKTVEFNTYRTGLNCWSCSETLHFTFSQPFNNLLCYFLLVGLL